ISDVWDVTLAHFTVSDCAAMTQTLSGIGRLNFQSKDRPEQHPAALLPSHTQLACVWLLLPWSGPQRRRHPERAPLAPKWRRASKSRLVTLPGYLDGASSGRSRGSAPRL